MKTLLVMLLLAAPLSAQIQGIQLIEATANDVTPSTTDLECGVAFVQFFLWNGTTETPIGPALTEPPYSFLWDSSTVSNGSYTLIARASDKAGKGLLCDSTAPNVGVHSVIIQVVNGDKTPPTVTIITPTAGAILKGNTPIEAAASSPLTIQRMELHIDGTLENANVQGLGTGQAVLRSNFNPNPPWVMRGAHHIEVRAVDSKAQTATKSVTVVKP